MSTYEFVYSNNPKYKILRHIAFWILIFGYFITVYSFRSGSTIIGYPLFLQYTSLEIPIVLSVDVAFCYAFIYLLLPSYLIKGKFIQFVLFLLLLLLIDAALSNYLYSLCINPLRTSFNLPLYKYISFVDMLMSLSNTVMITGIAAIIRLLKMWQIKKRELEIIKSEKINAQSKFIDTYIQPSFLPVLLKKIYAYSITSAAQVPEMLDKLQGIVNYLINDCNKPSVPLTKEIESINSFLQLERLTNKERLTINFNFNGNADNKRIPPFILFPLVENSFRQINDNIVDKHWVTISIDLEGFLLKLKISNSKPIETSNLLTYTTDTLQQLRKRLDILYPASHTLKVIIEEDSFIINLNLELKEAVG